MLNPKDLLPPPPWKGPPIPRILNKGNPGSLIWRDIQIGDIINIRTWIPRRAKLTRYVVVAKPDVPGYEGLIIRKPEGGDEMHIPGTAITKIELIGHMEV